MARFKTREIEIKESKGRFSVFSNKKTSKKDYDFEGISLLRKLLSNEKARILNVLKTSNPQSIYHLSKILERPFKAVFDDVKLLERFGFLNLLREKTKKRVRYRPELVVDFITIKLYV